VREVLRQPEALQISDDQMLHWWLGIFLHGLSVEAEEM